MNRVTGIGGIFIKVNDPDALRDRYRKHRRLDIKEWGGVAFRWHDPGRPDTNGSTVEESGYGKFGRVMDPEGNRVELWEPPPGPLP